jgi:hypothetical protein
MDRPDPARDLNLDLDLDPLRSLAEAALAHQETAQRQQADMQAPVDRDQTAKAEAPTTPSPAEAQQLAGHLTWTTVRHRAGHLPSTCGTPSRPGFSTAAFRGQVIDELMGTPATAAPPGTGRRGQRDRPPRPPHHPRDAARVAHARSRSHCEGSRAPA